MAGVRLGWAVDVTLAGAMYRFGTRELVVDGIQYHSGLELAEQSRVADLSEETKITISTADRWGDRFRAASWLVDGGDCVLYLVIEEEGALRRELWSRGSVDAAAWDRPGLPLTFALIPSAAWYQMQSPSYRIDSFTVPSDDPSIPTADTVWELHQPTFGLLYPMIIGYPGAFDESNTIPCVPAPILQISYEDFVLSSGTETLVEKFMLVIGDGHVGKRVVGTATAARVDKLEVGIKSLVGSTSSDDEHEVAIPQAPETIKFGYDLLGQPFAYLDMTIELQPYRGDSEAYVGYGLMTADGSGGGIQFRGRPLRGAADIFEWLVLFRSTHTLDVGRHRAAAEELNGYLIDTFVNQPVAANDWFEDGVLAYIPAAIVRGAEGVYLAHMPVTAEAKDARMTLEEGVNCTRTGAPTVRPVDANEVTVRWCLARDAYNRQRTLTAQQGIGYVFPSGAVYDDGRSRRNFVAELSQATYGVRTITLDLPTVWDVGTAERMAANFMIDHALPQRRFTYTLLPDYHWLHPGDIVLLTDADLGVTDQVCRVDDVTIGLVDVTVTVLPCKGQTAYL